MMPRPASSRSTSCRPSESSRRARTDTPAPDVEWPIPLRVCKHVSGLQTVYPCLARICSTRKRAERKLSLPLPTDVAREVHHIVTNMYNHSDDAVDVVQYFSAVHAANSALLFPTPAPTNPDAGGDDGRADDPDEQFTLADVMRELLESKREAKALQRMRDKNRAAFIHGLPFTSLAPVGHAKEAFRAEHAFVMSTTHAIEHASAQECLDELQFMDEPMPNDTPIDLLRTHVKIALGIPLTSTSYF